MKKYELFIEDKFRVFAPLDEDGRSEILDFLYIQDGLNKRDQKERRTMLARLERIAGDRRLPVKICHRADDDHKIWQVRSDKYRVLWFYDKGSIIICLSVFFKNTEGATPTKEISRACRIQAEYFEAKRKKQLMFIGENNGGE